MPRRSDDSRPRSCAWCAAGFPARALRCVCGEPLHVHEEELMADDFNLVRCASCARLLRVGHAPASQQP